MKSKRWTNGLALMAAAVIVTGCSADVDESGADRSDATAPPAAQDGAEEPAIAGPDGAPSESGGSSADPADEPSETPELVSPEPWAWPSCDVQPPATPSRTIASLWAFPPETPAPVWIAGVYVTAISGGGCNVNDTCQIFVQQQETFSSLADASQQAIRVLVTAGASGELAHLAVGDQVDVFAHALRKQTGGHDELILKISAAYAGCAAVVGSGTPTPLEGVTLQELTVESYEQLVGPLFVKIDAVAGTPRAAHKTFTLWDDVGYAAAEAPLSLSPFFTSAGSFDGLTEGQHQAFSSVTGVFAVYVPESTYGMKFKELYVRSMADVTLAGGS